MYSPHLSGGNFPHLDDEEETCSPMVCRLCLPSISKRQLNWELAHLRENHKTQSISISVHF